ncbi:sporulation protein YqfC [Clostridium sp. 'White wine YQ']|uniref:sporulation protein YqfC n=1 Tax=Clostridium sp. 'White wine YQ' TaxID=3027474 RepID=UPI00236676B6|nr:sporulation protein YqfC [Clostridium sp. 'White wine YQ']MDD7794528.1 sporulation protein YqfC [Clostridium sp. 'White wine YQ']
MESKWVRAKEKVIEELELPKDVMFNLPKITIVGNSEVCIENHKGIISFDRESVKVNSKIGTVLITGESFEISFIGGETLVIQGIFKSIVYEGII